MTSSSIVFLFLLFLQCFSNLFVGLAENKQAACWALRSSSICSAQGSWYCCLFLSLWL